MEDQTYIDTQRDRTRQCNHASPIARCALPKGHREDHDFRDYFARPLPEPPVQSGPTHTPLARLEVAEQHLNAQGDRDRFTAPDHETVRAAAELVRTRALAAIAHELAAFNARPRASDEAVQRALAAVGVDTSSTLHLAGLATHDKASSERGDGGPTCGTTWDGGDPERPLQLRCVLPQGHNGAHHA